MVYTVAFGNRRFGEMAMGLGRSLKLLGDQNPRAILTDIAGFPWEKAFHKKVDITVGKEDIWWAKFYALDKTDAEAYLFIDSDCLAFKRLDPVFEFFEGAPLGVQGVWKSSGEWYDADIAEVCRKENVEAIPQFNAGLMYFERGPEFDAILAEAKEIAKRAESLGFRSPRGVPSEEVCLSLAIARTGLGKVAHDGMDFQSSGVGLIGKLRMDVRRARCEFICRRHTLQWVSPYVFHAHFYSKFLIYWRQLRILEDLEKYEDAHPFGYMSAGHKFRRSIEKRILTARGKL